MKKQLKWNRWHRFTNNGVKQIKKVALNVQPDPLLEDGYTEWKPGTGPLNEEQYNNVTSAVLRACKGVPKTDEHKEKMRLAKLGKPKSEEHRKNMSLAWDRRKELGTSNKSRESKMKISKTMKRARIEMYRDAMEKLQLMRKQG
jgi:hypothetical protein